MASTTFDYNGQWTLVSGGVGTSVVSTGNGVLHRLFVPGTYVGTIQFDDAPSAAGTTSSSKMFTIGLPTTSVPTAIDLGINFKTGLVYQATGTPVVTIVWN